MSQKQTPKIEYWVERAFRPGVIADAAMDSGLDVAMRMNVGLIEMVIRPIKKELDDDDVRAFENRLRIGQVQFRRKQVF